MTPAKRTFSQALFSAYLDSSADQVHQLGLLKRGDFGAFNPRNLACCKAVSSDERSVYIR